MSKNNLVVITGANKGIGYAIVEKLLLNNQNFNIILTSRDISKGQEAVQKLKNTYPDEAYKLDFYQLDVTSKESIYKFSEHLKSSDQKVKILINNAGVASHEDIYANSFFPTEEIVDYTLGTNLYGVINLTNALLPLLEEDGKIINVSSILGVLSYQGDSIKQKLSDPGLTLENIYEIAESYRVAAKEKMQTELGFSRSVYNLSKALLNAYCRWVLKPQLKEAQSCFAVHPGWVKTDMGGAGADLSLEEGTVSTLKCVNFNLNDSKKYNGCFFNYDGVSRNY